MTVDCFKEEEEKSVSVEEVNWLIDKAIAAGKTRGYVLDRVSELGGYPTSQVFGDDYRLVDVTHFPKSKFEELSKEIAALSKVESRPTNEDWYQLEKEAAELGINGAQIFTIAKAVGVDMTVKKSCTWDDLDKVREAAYKWKHQSPPKPAPARDDREAQEKMDRALEEVFGECKEIAERSETSTSTIQMESIGSRTEAKSGTEGDTSIPSTSSTDFALNEKARTEASTSSSSPDIAGSEKSEANSSLSAHAAVASSQKKPGRSKKSAPASEDGSSASKTPSATSSEDCLVVDNDPSNFIWNQWKKKDIDLFVIGFNQELRANGFAAWIEPVNGPEPHFEIHVDGGDEVVRESVRLLIPEEQIQALKKASKHVLKALYGLSRKASELADLKANFEAMRREIEEAQTAIHSCYAADIEEWGKRVVDKHYKKADGSYSKKLVKTLAGVIEFRKTGGLKIDEEKLVASILAKPKEEREIYPISEDVVYKLDLEAFKQAGYHEMAEELQLEGIELTDVQELGKVSILAKPSR
ncbi:MAG: hypothetical protein LCH63_10205 [Candidatus Melainabacteria bacterium]|nr:hypothetical protein [Candidatus Melainabacteria bacterium]